MSAYTALVTGGSAGIGAEVCAVLRARGWRTVSVALELPAEGAEGLVADLSDPAACARVAAEVAGMGVTHLIHVAGAIRPALVEDARPEDIAILSQLHLGAALTLLQAVLPGMTAAGFGRVVLTGSRAALGVPTRGAYAATKAGMIGLARTWALELAPRGITVNVVSPGPIRTDNFWGVIPKGSEAEAALAARLPVGRLGEPSDVARAIAFFADPEAGFVTGQVLHVCGGASVGAMSL